MPIGGKLVLKGGVSLKAEKKKKRKKVPKDPSAAEQQQQQQQEEGAAAAQEGGAAAQEGGAAVQEGSTGGGGVVVTMPIVAAPKADPSSITVSGKTYEQEFDLEIARAKAGKVSSTPWGSSYKAPPKILHGYSKPVTGVTASERLDLRAASKTDKFCK